MATVTIGGKSYDLPPLVLNRMKKIWPLLSGFTQGSKPGDPQDNPVDASDTAVRILSVALEKTHPELTPEEIGERLTFPEMEALTPSLMALLSESGLIQAGKQREELEVILDLLQKPSTATSTPS